MKDEEMAEEWVRTKHNILKDCLSACVRAEYKNEIQAFLAGLKAGSQLDEVWHDYDAGEDCYEDSHEGRWVNREAGRPQWHEITDWKDNSQFPNDELKTYLVRSYQYYYVICELDITEGYRQFYLPDNLEYIDPQDVIAWCEIPTFDKE